MRNLNLEEVTEKIRDYASDIRYAERDHLVVKITQFFNFLISQPISKRTLERIEEEFSDLNTSIKEVRDNHTTSKSIKRVLSKLTTRELQGAFGYFEIRNQFEIENKYPRHYIQLAYNW